MNTPRHLLLTLTVLPFLLNFPFPAVSQSDVVEYACSHGYGNYTSNSTFQSNLQKFLSSMTSNTQINYGFYNLSVGQNLDKVSGIGLCRGDISTPDCLTCLRRASTNITQNCPTVKTAFGFNQYCEIGYSPSEIFKGLPVWLLHQNKSHIINGGIQNQKSFNHSISNLLMGLARQASEGDYRRKYETGEAEVKGKRVYAQVQCFPDMEEFDCWECLNIVVNHTLAECCYARQAAWVNGFSCSIRYDTYKFYGEPSVLPPLTSPRPSLMPSPSPSSITSRKGNRSKKVIVTIILFAIAVLLLVVVLAACYYFRRTKKPLKVENEEEEETITIDSLHMSFGMVKAATDNFSSSNRIGNGGFGTVYKGRLSNGQEIAVKRLNKNTGQGKQEFKNEALLMAKLQHRNLVRFLGFCIQKEEKLLIFELLRNKSLDNFLFCKFQPLTFNLAKCQTLPTRYQLLILSNHVDGNKRMNLDWLARYKIIQGIARGLLYLHEESRLLIIHRDLKPSNILLDSDMNPKISDFGMARLFDVDQSHANTKKIVGTYGYMPPEYVHHGQFSIKLDVFSFGVLVLEIVSGQKVSQFSEGDEGDSLLSSAWRNWLEGNALSLVDSTMLGVNTSEVLRCINIGLLCVQQNAVQRPIMSSVVLMLNSYTVTLPVPSRPAFLGQNDAET